MRYSKTHREETRARLLNASRAMAKREGFGATGVDALMASLGLSGGAFYRHFATKEALFEELVEREMRNSLDLLAADGDSPPEHFAKSLRGYLGARHARSPGEGCVLPSLGAEIARASPKLRRDVEQQLKKLKSAWARRTDDADAAWGLIAQCVGAILLARLVERESTQREILSASRNFLSKAIGLKI